MLKITYKLEQLMVPDDLREIRPNQITDSHRAMSVYFDDWLMVFENGDYIYTEMCPAWIYDDNGEPHNFTDVINYYLTSPDKWLRSGPSVADTECMGDI